MKILRYFVALILALAGTGCAGQMSHTKVTDDAAAKGIRYFGSASYEISVFRRVETAPRVFVYERVGDSRIATLADTSTLMNASYSSTSFSSQEFTVQLNKDGTLKSAKLEAQGSHPVAAAADAASAVLTKVDEIEKAKAKAEVDDKQRQVDLLTLQHKLDNLLQGLDPAKY